MNYFTKKKREWQIMCALWPEKSWRWRLKNLENFIDDPIDDIKHTLHGIEFMGHKFYLPLWLMPGAGKVDK